MENETININLPKRIFIVPYRNRLEQKFFYSKQMSFILEDEDDYEIYFSHQCDQRSFNRGATKNIGFLVIKEKYPNDYQDMTFIFNDVDTLPFHKIFNYQTTQGVVKHYYGFEYALGGIVVIKGCDFEAINGYPNYWGWGNEDTILQNRCHGKGLAIDRTQFYPIGSPEILQLFDGVSRIVAPQEHYKKQIDNGVNGLSSINRLTYSVDHESLNPKDNDHKVENDKIQIINILSFMTGAQFKEPEYYHYDLRDPPSKIGEKKEENRITDRNERVVETEHWKNIVQNPTFHLKEREKEIQKMIAAFMEEKKQIEMKEAQKQMIKMHNSKRLQQQQYQSQLQQQQQQLQQQYQLQQRHRMSVGLSGIR
jgi:hypothetical protein